MVIFLSQFGGEAESKQRKETKALELNQEKFGAVVEAALVKAGEGKRWRNAIVRAAIEAQLNPYIHFDGHALLVLSPSNEIYQSNGTCYTTDGEACKAFAKGFPCWHRALARLVERYQEANGLRLRK
jgi:hypothetical protein